MKKLIAALTLLAGAALCTPASANPPNDATIAGGCQAVGILDVSGNSAVYVWGGTAEAFSPTAGHNPVTLTSFTCQLRVDFTVVATAPGTVFGSSGVAVAPPYLNADSFDIVEICTSYSTVDAHLQVRNVGPICTPAITAGVGPRDLLCPLLQIVAPIQVDGILLIDATGDTYVLGILVIDC